MSIRTKLLFILVAFVAGPMVILALWIDASARRSLSDTHVAHLGSIADLKKDKVETYFAERKADVVSASQFSAVRRLLPVLKRHSRDRAHPEYAAAVAELDRQLQPFQEQHRFHDVHLIDADGTVVYVSNEAHRAAYLGKAPPDPKSFSEGRDGVHVTDMFEHRPAGVEVDMYIAAPVVDFEGVFAGVVTMEIEMGPVYDSIVDVGGLGDTGEVVIARLEGDAALFLFPLRHDPAAALTRTVRMGGPNGVPVQRAVKGETGGGIAPDYRGKSVLAAWRHIRSTGWGLVAKMDAIEAFAPATRLRDVVIASALLLLFLGVLAAWLVAASITKPVLALQKETETISGGDLNHAISVEASGEIGGFVRALDRMRLALKQKIAEQERTGADLKRSVRDLEHANREISNFAYAVSHDIKAPLRAIGSLTGVILHDCRDALNAETRVQAGYLQNRVRRLERLLEGILEYLHVGRDDEERACVDLDEVLTDAVECCGASPCFRVTREGRLPTLTLDRKQAFQVFAHLIDNAARFNDKPGGEASVGAAETDGVWRFHVRDNGPGIDPEHHEKIFRIFQTLRPRDELDTTGVGLAVVKKIVERNGGRVWVESKPGEGATFFFTLPKGGE